MNHPKCLISVSNTTRALEPAIKKCLQGHLVSAAARLPSKLIELSVILVGDRKMSRLHLQFMNISGPTDVLTFPIDEDADGQPISGEVYVCVPEAKRQAMARGTRLQDELLLYALHGMLHLNGFDDRTPREYRRMHRKEDEILSQLGIGRVFAPKATGVARVARPGDCLR